MEELNSALVLAPNLSCHLIPSSLFVTTNVSYDIVWFALLCATTGSNNKIACWL